MHRRHGASRDLYTHTLLCPWAVGSLPAVLRCNRYHCRAVIGSRRCITLHYITWHGMAPNLEFDSSGKTESAAARCTLPTASGEEKQAWNGERAETALRGEARRQRVQPRKRSDGSGSGGRGCFLRGLGSAGRFGVCGRERERAARGRASRLPGVCGCAVGSGRPLSQSRAWILPFPGLSRWGATISAPGTLGR